MTDKSWYTYPMMTTAVQNSPPVLHFYEAFLQRHDPKSEKMFL